jgi:hypothetical protein
MRRVEAPFIANAFGAKLTLAEPRCYRAMKTRFHALIRQWEMAFTCGH